MELENMRMKRLRRDGEAPADAEFRSKCNPKGGPRSCWAYPCVHVVEWGNHELARCMQDMGVEP